MSVDVIVSAGNSPYNVSAGQTDTGDIVVSGGSMFVLAKGGADETVVSSGGFLTIEKGGTDSGTTLAGIEDISGKDFGATIISGGTAVTLAGGLAIGDTVESGGEVIIQRGGVDVDITIASGGTGIVDRGGAIVVERGQTSVIGGTLINSGNVTAKDTGVLVLAGTVENSGSIRAIGVAAQIDLVGATISGGTLVTHGARAVIETVSGTSNSISEGTIWDGSFVEVTSGTTLSLTDETIRPGARVDVESGGVLTLSGGTIKPGVIVETDSGGTAIVSGTLADSGRLIAQGGSSFIVITGAVSGRPVEIDNGVVEIQSAGNENVVFQPGGTGGLQLDGLGSAYTGKVNKFGRDDSQFIDFANVGSGASVSYTPDNAANTSGTLMVTSGGVSATVTLVGHYNLADFTSSTDATGHVMITDPPPAPHGANMALFGNYIAATFPGLAGTQGGVAVVNALQSVDQALLASHPKT